MSILKIELSNKSYNIYIERGIIKKVGQHLKGICKGDKISVITDTNVHKLHGKKLRNIIEDNGFNVNFIVIEPGERSKSVKTLQYIYNELLNSNVTKNDLIIAFGGGVVGDIAGFAAATFLRGIQFVQIPTTLMAQIDSSIGGKVAVNLEKGKNLIGSFYQPEIVLIDPELLKTLDKRVFYDGMAEVIKYGCIKDKDLFEKLLSFRYDDELFKDMDNIIYCCCDIKREIVEKDEKDNDIRMLLNFGHTIGHAVEKYFDFETYTHGEAVAIGMYLITNKSEALGETKKGTGELIKQLLIKYNLPYDVTNVELEKIVENIKFDKKIKGSYINLILIKEIGKSYIKKIDKNIINRKLSSEKEIL